MIAALISDLSEMTNLIRNSAQVVVQTAQISSELCGLRSSVCPQSCEFFALQRAGIRAQWLAPWRPPDIERSLLCSERSSIPADKNLRSGAPSEALKSWEVVGTAKTRTA